MRLVTSMMTTRKLKKEEIGIAYDIIKNCFSDSECEIQEYKYPEDKYFETDIDVLNISFTKENIYHELEKLIQLYIKIMKELKINIDFIVSNDDTGTEVEQYQKDWNDVEKVGLFVTSREIPHIKKYYSDGEFSAYINLEHVSFGCVF